MPGGSSIEAISRLRERAPDTKIVVMTMEENPVFAQRAFAAGALGFVAKDRADEELPQAVRAAARGEEFVSPRIAARLDALHRSLTDDALSPREVEVLRLIALGHTSVEIARKLQPLAPYGRDATARTSTASSGSRRGPNWCATRYDAACSAPERLTSAPLQRRQTGVDERAAARRSRCSSVPPARATRSRIPASPKPSLAARGQSRCRRPAPRPAARRRPRRPRPARGLARACLATLVSASCTSRYTVVSRSSLKRAASLDGPGSSSSPSISNAALLAVAVEQRLDRGAQPELVQRGGPQLGDDRAQVRDLPLDVLDGLAHRCCARCRSSPRRAEESSTRSPPRPCSVSSCSSRAQRRRSASAAASELRSRSLCTLCASATAVAALAANVRISCSSSSLKTLPSSPRSNAASTPTPSPR